MLEAGKRYQHVNAITTMGMEVIKVINRTDKVITMEIGFFHLKNGKAQYTGKVGGYFEIVELAAEKEADWFIYKPEDYVLKEVKKEGSF